METLRCSYTFLRGANFTARFGGQQMSKHFREGTAGGSQGTDLSAQGLSVERPWPTNPRTLSAELQESLGMIVADCGLPPLLGISENHRNPRLQSIPTREVPKGYGKRSFPEDRQGACIRRLSMGSSGRSNWPLHLSLSVQTQPASFQQDPQPETALTEGSLP